MIMLYGQRHDYVVLTIERKLALVLYRGLATSSGVVARVCFIYETLGPAAQVHVHMAMIDDKRRFALYSDTRQKIQHVVADCRWPFRGVPFLVIEEKRAM